METLVNIQVIGDNTAAVQLRQHLESLGYSLTTVGGSYSVRLSEHEEANVFLRGREGDFAAKIVGMVKELTHVPVHLEINPDGAEGNTYVHYHPSAATAVELGVLRALLAVTGHGAPPAPAGKAVGWLKKLFK